MSIAKTMVKSDGNGAYIVDKKLWSVVMAVMTLLFGLVVWGGQQVIGDAKATNAVLMQHNIEAEGWKKRIEFLERRFDRIEEKLDRALK